MCYVQPQLWQVCVMKCDEMSDNISNPHCYFVCIHEHFVLVCDQGLVVLNKPTLVSGSGR